MVPSASGALGRCCQERRATDSQHHTDNLCWRQSLAQEQPGQDNRGRGIQRADDCHDGQESLLGSQLKLPDAIWARLTVAWVAYFLFMATINGYVAAYFTTEAWVNFKLWGYAFPVAFIVGQGLYVARHLKDDVKDTRA